jgi:hypothetical protein
MFVVIPAILLFASYTAAEGVTHANKISAITTYPDGSVVTSVNKENSTQKDGDPKDYQPCVINNVYYARLPPDSPLHKSSLALLISAAITNKKVNIHTTYDSNQYYGCTVKHVTELF